MTINPSAKGFAVTTTDGVSRIIPYDSILKIGHNDSGQAIVLIADSSTPVSETLSSPSFSDIEAALAPSSTPDPTAFGFQAETSSTDIIIPWNAVNRVAETGVNAATVTIIGPTPAAFPLTSPDFATLSGAMV